MSEKDWLKYLFIPALLLLIDCFFGFQVYSNDFLGYLGLASIIDLGDPSTYYNGVYPPGFVMFLSIVISTKTNILIILKALNYMSLGVAFYFFHTRFFKGINFSFVFFAFVILLVSNKIFLTNILSPGSYALFLICSVIGLIFYDSEDHSKFLISAIGLIFATFLRFEGIVWLICVWSSSVYFNPSMARRWMGYIPLIVSFFLLFVINYYGTASILATRHFLTFEAPDWINLSPSTSFYKQELSDYLFGYLNSVGRDAHYFILLLVSWILLKPSRGLILPLIFYLVIIKLHSSPRGMFLALPFIHVFLIQILFVFWQKSRALTTDLVILLLPIFIYFSLNNYYEKRVIQFTSNSFHKIDLELQNLDQDWRVQSVFTNSHDFYIKSQLPEIAKVNGGWVKLITSFYLQNPNFELEDIDKFHKSLEMEKIRFVVIDSGLIHPSVYSGHALITFRGMDDSEFFKKISLVDSRFIIYQVLW